MIRKIKIKVKKKESKGIPRNQELDLYVKKVNADVKPSSVSSSSFSLPSSPYFSTTKQNPLTIY